MVGKRVLVDSHAVLLLISSFLNPTTTTSKGYLCNNNSFHISMLRRYIFHSDRAQQYTNQKHTPSSPPGTVRFAFDASRTSPPPSFRYATTRPSPAQPLNPPSGPGSRTSRPLRAGFPELPVRMVGWFRSPHLEASKSMASRLSRVSRRFSPRIAASAQRRRSEAKAAGRRHAKAGSVFDRPKEEPKRRLKGGAEEKKGSWFGLGCHMVSNYQTRKRCGMTG